MDNLTVGEIILVTIGAILALCGFISTVGNAVEKVIRWFKASKAPTDNLTDRVVSLESWKETIERKLAKDKEHFAAIDDSNRVTQVALLALLDHGIDGNNIEQMRHAKEELQTHLINR